jgi:transposase
VDEDFLGRCHKRSNVEATFSTIKRVLGDSVRSRTETARRNEVLLKVLCHNIRVLIHEIHALGITPSFPQLGAAS